METVAAAESDDMRGFCVEGNSADVLQRQDYMTLLRDSESKDRRISNMDNKFREMDRTIADLTQRLQRINKEKMDGWNQVAGQEREMTHYRDSAERLKNENTAFKHQLDTYRKDYDEEKRCTVLKETYLRSELKKGKEKFADVETVLRKEKQDLLKHVDVTVSWYENRLKYFRDGLSYLLEYCDEMNFGAVLPSPTTGIHRTSGRVNGRQADFHIRNTCETRAMEDGMDHRTGWTECDEGRGVGQDEVDSVQRQVCKRCNRSIEGGPRPMLQHLAECIVR